LRGKRGAYHAGGARSIVDQHGLPEAVGQLLGQNARDDVGGSTRRVRNDYAYRLIRKIFRAPRKRRRDKAIQADEQIR